jgi:hypothetical protein
MREFSEGLRVLAMLGAIALGADAIGGVSAALAAPNCSNFFSNADGSWTPTHPILMAGPASQTQLSPGDRLRAGAPGLGGRIGRYLDTHCRFARSAVGPGRIPLVP